MFANHVCCCFALSAMFVIVYIVSHVCYCFAMSSLLCVVEEVGSRSGCLCDLGSGPMNLSPGALV